jgi:hypothetical protein
MPKYGLFSGSAKQPDQTFEGDTMKQDKEYVYIYLDTDMNKPRVQVAAVKLGPGQVVKVIN